MERTIYSNSKHFGPRKDLATKAAKKSAPIYGQEDYSEESCSEEEEVDGDQYGVSDCNVAKSLEADRLRQRERLFTNLLNALCIPSDEMFFAFNVIKPTQGLFLSSLCIEEIGRLRIPLSETDVLKLHAVGEQADFATVFRCWHVEASKVTFPEAADFISNTVKPVAMKAVKDLGRYAAVMDLEVELNKLIFCETGGHYTFDGNARKQEKKKTFATFMIQVPMEDGHTGGELLVHHKGSVKSCDWHMASSLGFSSAIFFADCERVQQQKIKSGTQLCLIFDLVRRDNLSGKALRGEYISKKVGEAEAVLNHWMEGATEGKPKLAIPLRQRFPVEKLSFATLCGDDSIVVEILKNCKDKNGKPLLNLHLCLVEKYQTGKAVPGPDYCIDEEEESEDDLYNAKNHIMGDIDEESIDIGSWVGMESTDDKALKAFSRLGLDAKDFVVRVGEKAFHDEPTEVEFDMGWKAGCASTLQEWYQGTMLIVWSRGLSFSPARHGKKRQKSM